MSPQLTDTHETIENILSILPLKRPQREITMNIEDIDLKDRIKAIIMAHPGRIDEMEQRCEEEVDEVAEEITRMVTEEIKKFLAEQD